MKKKSEFVQKLIVREDHLDELHHVNNVVYVQWIQDIAGEHWLSQAPDEIHNQVLWVVTKHVINYKSPCQLGEVLTLKTETPEAFHGALWDRNVWIYRPEGQLAIEATTTWCLLDRQSMRPRRITPEIHQIFIASTNG
jgi:acyl-CoA thioester hydrolase